MALEASSASYGGDPSCQGADKILVQYCNKGRRGKGRGSKGLLVGATASVHDDENAQCCASERLGSFPYTLAHSGGGMRPP